MRGATIGASILILVAFAFVLGRFAGGSPQPGPARVQVASPDQPVDPQTLENEAARADQLQQLEKQVATLKKENAELKADRADLQNKLSVAADTVNKMRISLREAQRKAEEAEWRAKQASPITAPVPTGTP